MSSARPDTWMPLFWGDYAKDTGHLSAAEHGAYLMLIKHYWSTGAPLPNDPAKLWRIACADSVSHWRKLSETVLTFFQVDGAKLHHKRVDTELRKAGVRMATASEKARKAAEARWAGHGDAVPEAEHGECSEDAPSIGQALLEECPSQSPSQSYSPPPNFERNDIAASAAHPHEEADAEQTNRNDGAAMGVGAKVLVAGVGDLLAPAAGGGHSGGVGKARRAGNNARKCRLPAEWKPSVEQLGYARDQGCDPESTALEFREFYHSSGALWVDWNLVFKRWCRNQKNFHQPANAIARNGHAEPPSKMEGWMELANMFDRKEQENAE